MASFITLELGTYLAGVELIRNKLLRGVVKIQQLLPVSTDLEDLGYFHATIRANNVMRNLKSFALKGPVIIDKDSQIGYPLLRNNRNNKEGQLQ